MRFTIAFLVTCLIAFVIFYNSKTKEATNLITVDTIVFNGRVYTVDSSFATTESFAIKNGRIIETGKSAYILGKYQSVNTINANGNAVFPGFIDSHCHFLNYGLGLNQVELVGTKSFDEVIDRVETYSDNYLTGETTISDTRWIIGRGWDQNDWELKEYPTNEKLNLLFPNTPVILKRVDGHAALANSKALAIANISATTKLTGGEVILKNGKPTGVLIDNAVDLVTATIPQPDFKTIKQALLLAEQNCFAVGLTTVTDAGLNQGLQYILPGDGPGEFVSKYHWGLRLRFHLTYLALSGNKA